MNWYEIAARAPADQVEAVVAWMQPWSPTGAVAEEQWGDPNDLAPRALLPEIHCKIYLPEAELNQEQQSQLMLDFASSFPGLPPLAIRLYAEQDWATAWRENYQTFRLGQRFVIQPSWLVAAGWPNPKAADIPLVIEPGMAFGTGQHETTQLCLKAMEELVRPGMAILDMGTGSGILGIAAHKMGAGPILGVDNDPVAIEVAHENAALNGVTGQIEWRVGSLAEAPAGVWDLVIVNILAVIIKTMVSDGDLLQFARPGGCYLLSGIIAAQRDMMAAAIEAAGGRIIYEWQDGDWIALQVTVP